MGRSTGTGPPSTAAAPGRPAPIEEVFVLEEILDDVLGQEVVEDLVVEAEPRRRRRPAPAPEAVRARQGPAGVLPAGTGPAAPRRAGRQEPAHLPPEVAQELANAVGEERGAKLGQRLAAAARAYERDRYQDALRVTRPLVDEVPDSPAARELHGLVCYRLGRWREALAHLTAAADLGGDDPSQLPVRMDCHRALGHHRKVRELWDVLRAASPPADVLVEGRLVLAADLADQDRLADAISLLTAAGAARDLRRPSDRHLRQWYLLADLSERAGDLGRARQLFARVAAADPELADAATRLAALGGVAAGPAGADGRSPTTLGAIARAGRSARRP